MDPLPLTLGPAPSPPPPTPPNLSRPRPALWNDPARWIQPLKLMHNPDSGASPGADPGSETRTLGQVTPDRSGPCGPQLGRRSRGTSRGRCPWASRAPAGEAAAARGLTGGGPTQDTRWRHGRRAFPGYAARGGLL